MATAKLTIPAITCDCTVDDGDAPFWLSAPSYTIVLLTSGVVLSALVLSVLCPCDAFWLHSLPKT
ncbi:hypothetical protein OIU76_001322 [Salix suchowensis]|nr:hypothetical protein OIU76_001322 [Salix suchowensis]